MFTIHAFILHKLKAPYEVVGGS